MTASIIRQSIITCPACGYARSETMPINACQWFYQCEGCQAVLHPQPGDCCVFCSYGSVPCPPRQRDGVSCCGKAPETR
jgi:hypothetical protein